MKKLLSRLIILLSALALIVTCLYWNKANNITVRKKNSSQLSKEEFGKLLFEDKRLSRDTTIACISCHIEQRAFTDGKPRSIGIGGKLALRNAPSLFNLVDAPYFMADGAVPTLEMQAIIPIQDLNEMGFSMGELVERLKRIKNYENLSISLYNRELDAFVITRALASYERTLISKNSKFDNFLESNFAKGFSESERRGWDIFKNELKCIECHALPNFTNYQFKSNGLTQPKLEDQGRFRITGNELDKGLYKVPSLRNIALTAPYMHDGSIKNLEEVLQSYLDKNKGSTIHKIVKQKSDDKKIIDLKSFLYTLTDSSLVIYLMDK